MQTATTQPRQIVITKYGPAQTLSFQPTLPKAPEVGQVAIDVAYSGLNFADIQMRLGFYPDAPPKPFVPGYEVSGVVSGVGTGVTRFKEGDEVVAGTVFGGYSSTITLPEANVFTKPAGASLAQSAALPVNFFTAHLALNEMGRIRKGDRVMIECATGGVGTLAIQMALQMGAEVVGLTRTPAKKPYIEKLGAIAMTRKEFDEDAAVTGFDFILNASGGPHIREQMKRLAKTGRIVCMGMNAGVKDGKRSILRMLKTVAQARKLSVLQLFQDNVGIFGLNALHILQDPQWVARLGRAFEDMPESALVPHVGKTFAASEVAQAHEYLQTGQAVGKVLLEW